MNPQPDIPYQPTVQELEQAAMLDAMDRAKAGASLAYQAPMNQLGSAVIVLTSPGTELKELEAQLRGKEQTPDPLSQHP